VKASSGPVDDRQINLTECSGRKKDILCGCSNIPPEVEIPLHRQKHRETVFGFHLRVKHESSPKVVTSDIPPSMFAEEGRLSSCVRLSLIVGKLWTKEINTFSWIGESA
jgi:hypothetical protein